jgi:hypothetical protein
MRRRLWLTATVLVAFAACGDEINGPQTTEEQTVITVELDWQLAREPWVLASGWELEVPSSDEGPSCPSGFVDPCWSSRTTNLTTIDEGLFESDGSAEIRFSALCARGQPLGGHVILPWALKSSHRQGFRGRYWQECTPGFVSLICSDGVQRITITDPPDNSRCTVNGWVETEIHLTLHWPLSREPGFEDATWALTKQQPTDSQSTIEWVTVNDGSFLTDGTAEVRFTTFCEPGEERRLNETIELSGHFGAYEDSLADPECRRRSDLRCTADTQLLEFVFESRSDPPQQCKSPAEDQS